MASIISSSDQRLSTSKRRLKPLMLRDYLLDDLSSCSSNGFKSFPRRQTSTPSSSSTVRRYLDAEIKRSGLILHHHHKPRRLRTSCGTAISHAVNKASKVFLNAVKLVTFPSTTVKKPGVFSRSFSKRFISKIFWRKPVSQSRREITGDGDGEIQWWRSAAYFSDEETSDLISHISTVDESISSSSISPAVITTVEFISGGSDSSSITEIFTNSSSSFSTTWNGELSNKNDAVEDGEESLEGQDCDESYVDGNGMECVNDEEKEQLSPVSILECPFEDDEGDDDDDDDDDDAIDDLFPNQNDTYEKIFARKSRRLNGWVRLEPLDLEKHIEKHEGRQEALRTEQDEPQNRLFALVKSRICETNELLDSKAVDNLLLDYLQDYDVGAKEETIMVKKVEDWVMGREEEMFMSWEVIEKRQVYVKEMKWGCVNGDERESVVEDLANGFFTYLVDEFIFDLASS